VTTQDLELPAPAGAPDQELPPGDFGVALADALRHIQDSVAASVAEAREAIREVADALANRDAKLAKRVSGLENRIGTLSDQAGCLQSDLRAIGDMDVTIAERVEMLTGSLERRPRG